MTNLNDSKILQLKKQIEEKKQKLKTITKFTPVTNCSLSHNNKIHNINVCNKEEIVDLLIDLNSKLLSAKELKLDEDYKINGYSLIDWITDLKTKLNILSQKDEEKKLKMMEDKLTQMLSNEKKTELELLEMEELLR